MSRDSETHSETRGILRQFLCVSMLVPLLCGLLSYGYVSSFAVELDAKLLRQLILAGWGSTMCALATTFFLHMRKRPQPQSTGRASRAVASRMNWERKSETRLARELLRATLMLPICTLTILYAAQFLLGFVQSNRDLRLLAAVVIPLWIIVLARQALRTRSLRLG